MENLKVIWYHLPLKLKMNCYVTIGVALMLSIFDLISIAAVLPFLSILADPSVIQSNNFINFLYLTYQSAGIRNEDQFVIAIGISLLAVIIASALLKIISQFITNTFIEMVRADLSGRLLYKYLNQNYEFFLKNNTSDIVKTCILEVDQFSANLLRPVFTAIIFSFIFVLVLVMLLIVNPILSLSTAGALFILYVLFYQLIKNKITSLGALVVRSNRSRLLSINETLGDIKQVKLQNNEKKEHEAYYDYARRLSISSAQHLTLSQAPNAIIELMAFGGLIFSIVLSLLYHSGPIEGMLTNHLPIIGLYAFSALKLIPALRNIFAGAISLKYSERLSENIASALILSDNEKPEPTRETVNLIDDQLISLTNVYYTYTKSNNALTNINMKISRGTATAIVGQTGSGKSTLINLLLGLVSPSRGDIFWGNAQLQESNIPAWQKTIGYVPQEPHFKDCTILENIARGVPKVEIDIGRIHEVAKICAIHDFIVNELKDGYDTVIGENAKMLSGGQKQRVAIARALYQKPQLLILDEATSALDNTTEAKLLRRLLAQTSVGLTIILVTHRLQNLKEFSHVTMLKHGEVIDSGTYFEMGNNSENFKSLMDGTEK